MQRLIRAQWPQDICGSFFFFLPEELIITINGGIRNRDSSGSRTPNWIIPCSRWTSAVAAGIISWNVFSLWVGETAKICCFVFKSDFFFVSRRQRNWSQMAAIIFLHHHRSRAGRCHPAPWSSLPPGIKQILTTPISSSLKRQSWLCSMSPERPTAGTRGGRKVSQDNLLGGFVLFLIYGINRCFHVSSLVPGWLVPITNEPNSLIICRVPLWRRPHCLSAQFPSSTKMIASFWFGGFTQENIQIWLFQQRRNGQKWEVSSRLRHWWQARNIPNQLIS